MGGEISSSMTKTYLRATGTLVWLVPWPSVNGARDGDGARVRFACVCLSCATCCGVSQCCSGGSVRPLWNPSNFICSKKSERQPTAKESQRQKGLASPALALNQTKTACQVTPGENAAPSSVKACDSEHAVGLLRHRTWKWKGSTPIYLLLTIG